VLVVTSDASDRVQSEVLDAGADDFLVKPFKPALVAARVRAALRRSAGRVP
jgi:DNA-binding response OmpR family regulator